jgi:hypothetical protein
MVHNEGIEIIANYLFGLPGETHKSMSNTLELSLDLCTIAWNGYAAMALPGSALHKQALDQEYELPSDYTGYSFHSYDTLPLPTNTLSPSEILKFRDRAFHTYHRNPKFLEKVGDRYGEQAVRNIIDMTKIK